MPNNVWQRGTDHGPIAPIIKGSILGLGSSSADYRADLILGQPQGLVAAHSDSVSELLGHASQDEGLEKPASVNNLTRSSSDQACVVL